MANYIGNKPLDGDFRRLDSIASSFDGSTTQFNLTYNTATRSVGDAAQLIVSLNGVIQEPLNAYTLGIGGNSIIFASAPASGDTCHIVQLGAVGSTITPTDGSVTASKLDASLKDYYEDEFTADGSTTDFTLSRSAVGVNQLMVTVDGIVQPTSAYSASGTTFTISPALPNGTNIRVVHMGVKAGVYVPAQNSIGLTELDLTALDGRYYTETESDSRYIQSVSNFSVSNDRAQHQTRLTTQKLTGLGSTGRIDITGDNDVSTGLHVLDSGNVGIGTQTPNALTHIRSGASGASSGPHVYTKLHVEHNTHSAIQLSSASTSEQWIWFADDTSATPVGGITYYHGGPYMAFRVEGSEAARIASDGSFLVGSDNSNLGSSSTEEGIVLNATGTMASSRSGNIASVFNRLSSDGHVVQIRRDGGNLAGGSNAGHLGVVTASGQSRLYLGNSNTSLRFNNGIDSITPCNNDGNDRDAAINLGSSGVRFQNIYLSNGIDFSAASGSGTGTSNLLDDYEEGTWSANDISGAGLSVTTNRAWYVKIGSLVTISASIQFPTTTNTTAIELAIPFTSTIQSYYAAEGSIGYTNVTTTLAEKHIRPIIENGGSNVLFYYSNGTRMNYSEVSGRRLDFTISYQKK